jgi:hypothetical protein
MTLRQEMTGKDTISRKNVPRLSPGLQKRVTKIHPGRFSFQGVNLYADALHTTPRPFSVLLRLARVSFA